MLSKVVFGETVLRGSAYAMDDSRVSVDREENPMGLCRLQIRL